MPRTYSETLKFLYSQLPMYQRIGAPAMKKDLGNTIALLEALGNPHLTYPTIHIAGTNGKGTVSHMIAGCLQAAGYKTGLYTSPHYRDFRERVKVDGRMISEEDVIDFVEQMEPAIARIEPSFFEMTVAMAFDQFRKEKVDVAVIETGLGGRLDSTNVVLPEISIITNISYDHMAMLGDTLTLIAGEKAGIIKPDVPVVIGERGEESDVVFDRIASERKSSITYSGDLYDSKAPVSFDTVIPVSLSSKADKDEQTLLVANAGPFTALNTRTAYVALEQLSKSSSILGVESADIETGLRSFAELTDYTGRWKILGQNPTILADSAHNEAGLSAVTKAINDFEGGHVRLVLGFASDKDLATVLPMFPDSATYYFCKPNVPRGMATSLIADAARVAGLAFGEYESVNDALEAAKADSSEDDLIFVGGSSFVVAEVV